MSYAMTGFGDTPAESYAKTVTGLIGSIANDPAIKSEMSPGALAALDITKQSLLAISKGDMSKLTDQLVGLALTTATDILRVVAKEVGLSALAEGASVIPLVGTMISVIAASAGAGSAVSDRYTPAGMTAYCETPGDGLRMPRSYGSGPGGAYLPADLLVETATEIVSGPDKGKRHLYPTTLAMTIQYATETLTMDKRGLDVKRRVAYAALRNAIQQSYKRQGSDGGATLWILYVDMLRADREAGRLPDALINELSILSGGADLWGRYQLGDLWFRYNGRDDVGLAPTDANNKANIAAAYRQGGWNAARNRAAEILGKTLDTTYCGPWSDAGQRQMYQIIDVWHQTISPYYVQFKSLESQAKSIAAQMLAPKKAPTKATTAVVKPLSASTSSPVAKKKMNPIAAVTVGVGVAAVAVALLLPKR